MWGPSYHNCLRCAYTSERNGHFSYRQTKGRNTVIHGMKRMWNETILGSLKVLSKIFPEELKETTKTLRIAGHTGTRNQAHDQGLKGAVELKTEECYEVGLATATYRKLPASLFTITRLVIYISFSEPVWGNCAFYFVWKCSICWWGTVSIVPSVRKVVDIYTNVKEPEKMHCK